MPPTGARAKLQKSALAWGGAAMARRTGVHRCGDRWVTGALRGCRASVLAAAAIIVTVASARAQSETASDRNGAGAASEEQVVVTAPQIDQMVRSFVGEVSSAGQLDQLGRWDRRICPGVAGMRRQYAQALIDRLAVIAFSVGLDVGEPGCSPNVLIFLTEDSDALAQELVRQHGDLVSNRNRHGNTRGRDALRDFATTSRPVRWWHVTQSFTSDGFRVLPGEEVTVRSMGRLRRGTREDFDRVLIIIDAKRIDGIRFGAVADYVAMAVLAQLNPNADTSAYSTILNLFSDQSSRPTTITEWDLSYLNGLYAATRDARNADRQERDIARRMREQVEHPPAEAPE